MWEWIIAGTPVSNPYANLESQGVLYVQATQSMADCLALAGFIVRSGLWRRKIHGTGILWSW